MEESVISLSQKLIAIASVSTDNEQLQTIFNLVEKEFKGLPLIVKRFQKDNKPSLVVTFTDTKTPDIFLNGHLDVVAGTESQFHSSIKNNRLYGRGAYDMKAACAVMIELMKDLAKTDIAKDRVGLMLVPDEEVGGFDGTGFLVKKGYKPKQLFLVGEGTDFAIERETKGALWFKLSAKGKASHGAYPWKGANAIMPITNSLIRLAALYPHPASETWETTFVVTQINGGKSLNIVPEYSEATIDMRYPIEDNSLHIIEKVKSVLDRGVSLEIILNQPPHSTHERHATLLRLQKITREVTGRAAKMVKKHGISDTKFFANTKVPACGFGPIGANLHHNNEYVSLESLPMYYEILKRLILQK